MEKLTPEAIQEWLQFASQNVQAIRDLVKDENENAEVEVAGCCPPPLTSPCCCPKIVKLFVFAWDVDIYTAACPEFVD